MVCLANLSKSSPPNPSTSPAPPSLDMFEEDEWLPPYPNKSVIGRFAVPRMPQNKVKRAAYVYGPGQEYKLHNNHFPFPPSTTGASPAFAVAELDASSKFASSNPELGPDSTTPFTSILQNNDSPIIRIIEPIDIGYHHKTQVVLAELLSGSKHCGKKIIMRAYDQLFICPGDLPVVDIPKLESTPG